MDEKAKENVLELLEAAKKHLEDGEIAEAKAKITSVEETINPLPGTGTNGGIKK